MVDPHLLASGVCEKERKSELNSRAAGKGVWHPSEGASRGAAAASKRARAARRRACGVGRGETMLAGTRIPHHPHVRAHHAAIPPHSQAPSPSDAATPSGGLADDERDEAAAPPGWPARASRWPVQRGGTGSPILARALADARRSREGKSWAKCPVCQSFTATSRRNESDRRLPACTSVCALQFYTESTRGTSSQSLVERSYGHSPLVCNDVEHCSTSLNTIE